jgi:hypothetical protein
MRNGKPLYQVDARRKGTTGTREHFSVKAEAERRAGEIAGDFERLGNEGLEFPNDLRVNRWSLSVSQRLKVISASFIRASRSTSFPSVLSKTKGFPFLSNRKAMKPFGISLTPSLSSGFKIFRSQFFNQP